MLNDDVEYFLSAISHGSLARAAERLGITQPALSKSIRRIERRAGVALLLRSSKGVELTPAGKAFHSRMLLITREAREAMQEARDLGGSYAGQLRIGANPAGTSLVLNALLPTLQVERPAATISFMCAFSEVIVDLLTRREIELGVCPLSDQLQEGLEKELLFDDPYYLVVNQHHPLASRTSVALADLVGWDWAGAPKNEFGRSRTERVFAENGLPQPKFVVEINCPTALYTTIVNTQLISLFTPRHELTEKFKHQLRLIPIVQAGFSCPVWMVWRQGYLPSVALRAQELIRAAASASSDSKEASYL